MKEPSGETKARETDGEMDEAPGYEEENDNSGSLKHAADSLDCTAVRHAA